MAAQRFAGTKVNWKSILDRFPTKEEEQVSKLMKLKKNHETYIRRLVALPEKPPAIDWAAYKSKIPNAAFVDAIKQKYEAIQIPYPKSNVDADINAKEQELAKAVADTQAENQKIIQSLNEKISELEDMMPIEKMTLQEFKQAYPEIGPSTTHPTPWPCDDPENNREWRVYIAAKEKGIPAERPRG